MVWAWGVCAGQSRGVAQTSACLGKVAGRAPGRMTPPGASGTHCRPGAQRGGEALAAWSRA